MTKKSWVYNLEEGTRQFRCLTKKILKSQNFTIFIWVIIACGVVVWIWWSHCHILDLFPSQGMLVLWVDCPHQGFHSLYSSSSFCRTYSNMNCRTPWLSNSFFSQAVRLLKTSKLLSLPPPAPPYKIKYVWLITLIHLLDITLTYASHPVAHDVLPLTYIQSNKAFKSLNY